MLSGSLERERPGPCSSMGSPRDRTIDIRCFPSTFNANSLLKEVGFLFLTNVNECIIIMWFPPHIGSVSALHTVIRGEQRLGSHGIRSEVEPTIYDRSCVYWCMYTTAASRGLQRATSYHIHVQMFENANHHRVRGGVSTKTESQQQRGMIFHLETSR